jgi:cytochrome c553
LIGAMVCGPAVAADVEAGKKKAAEVCAACHGADGNSSNAAYPKLAGQNEDYLRVALNAYKKGERKNAIMAGFAGALSKQDIANLAAYFAGQSSSLHVKY